MNKTDHIILTIIFFAIAFSCIGAGQYQNGLTHYCLIGAGLLGMVGMVRSIYRACEGQ